jgi:hypothetical protein
VSTGRTASTSTAFRAYRLSRVREQLEASDLGAVLVFETSDIRHATRTHIGY